MTLRESIIAWHRKKYPKAYNADIGVKLGEECGEVLRAMDRIRYARVGQDIDDLYANLREEIGDVLIVLTVLADRYGINIEGVCEERAAVVMAR